MTVIEAAILILKENNKPTTARELAVEMLKRNMVNSNAKDKITSLAATLTKTINNCDDLEFPLCYWSQVSRNRLVGLKEWKKDNQRLDTGTHNNISNDHNTIEENITIVLPRKIINKLKFTYESKIKDSFEDYVVYIIEKGLEFTEEEVKAALTKKINDIYG